MKKIGVLLFLGLLLFACSSDNDPDEIDQSPPVNFDRSAMLENWADNIIIPAYADFSDKVNQLEAANALFIQEQNNGNLEGLRNAWKDAYTVWQRVSMFEIGPAEVINFRLNVNIYPANTSLILNNIDTGNYDLNLSSNRVAKGFPAIDYLLFGIGATDQAILDTFTGIEGQNERQYISDLIADIKGMTQQVSSEWNNGYRDTFVNNDGSSATASVDRFVNDYLFYFEKHLRAGKMGIPAGVFSGTVLPENEEAFYNGTISKSLFLEGLTAVQDFYNGKHYTSASRGESLRSYINALNTLKEGEDLNSIINNQFATAENAVSNLGLFSSELNSNPPTEFLNAYDEVQRIVPLLKVDMVSAMSISIDFVDADGD